MKTKNAWLLLGILLLLSVLIPNFSTNAQTGVNPGGFWVRSGDIICFEVVEASINDTDGIPIWDTYPSPVLNASDYITFMPDNIPDWATDPFEPMNYTIYIDGFVDDFHLSSAPWEMNYLNVDGPPAFTPILPIGDSNYWDDLRTELENQGFQVNINTTSDIFHYEYSDANLSVSADVKMTTGALNYYTTTISSYEEGELYVMKLTFQLYVIFTPSQATLEWAFMFPVVDYNIIQAGYPNGTQGLEIVPSDDGEHNPIWGEGYIYPNQLLSVDIEELPDLSVEDPNYMAHFMTDTGRFEFNITLDVPRPYPQENNSGFLYPLMPVITDDLARVIQGVALSLGTNYSVEMSNDWIKLEFSDGQRSIRANWSRATGVLTSYYYMENPSGDYPGMVIELKLAVSGDIADYDFHWGENEGVVHYYKVNDAALGNNNSIPVDDGNENIIGYLYAGDLLEVKAIKFSNFEEEGPCVTYEMKNLNQSWTTTIEIEIERPGHLIAEHGPPYLYFHFLVGSDPGYEWFQAVMVAAGASVTFGTFTGNYEEMQLNWDYYVNGDKGFSLNAIWNRSNGVLTYYSLEYWGDVMEGPDGEYLKLSFSLFTEAPPTTTTTTTNTTETTETTPMFLDAPQILIFSMTLALIALSIRKLKIKV